MFSICPPRCLARTAMSDSSSDDDVPLSQLQAAQPAKPPPKKAKPKAKPPPAESSSSDDEPVKPPPKKKGRASAAKPKYTNSSSDSDSDSDDEPVAKKRAARKPAKRKAAPKKDKAPAKRARKSSSGAAKKPKTLTKLQRLEKALGAFEWWNAPDPPQGKAWTTLEHAGVTFEPQYVPHGVPLVYAGAPVKLTPRQEELATFYASMPEDGPQLSKTGGQREIFQKNFWDDFSKALGASHTIKQFKGCDFSRITEHLDRAKAIRRSASDAEKKANKERKDKDMLKTGFSLLDGHVEKVGNFRAEPPSLFRGRGKHPRTGVVKQRLEPDRVAINVGRDRAPPRCFEPGRSWSDVQHDDSVTWLATWHENVMSQNKYVMLAANSSLKGKSDFNKFQKAMQLKGCIDKVRRDYQRHLDSSDRFLKQQATTMWLIDVLALRVGGEKNEDEADTVGCCSLRVEHFTFHAGGKDVDLEFLGKDSIRFLQSIDFQNVDASGPKVHANLVAFTKGKSKNEQAFDLITPTELNKHLSSIMPGLTAKVFRTYNASETLQNQLPKAADVKKLPTPQDKIVAYNEANRTVAILCNHQRTVSAAAATGLEEKADRLEQLKTQRRDLQAWKGLSSKKIPLHSGEDPGKKAAELVDQAKTMKNEAKTNDEKVAATKAYESAMDKRRKANKEKQSEAHKFKNTPDSDAISKRIDAWTEKIKKMEVELRNKEENKEVSLGTSKANYMDPRITVAWCRRCDLEISRLFPKTLKDKFNWAMGVDGDWRFEAAQPKEK